MSNLVHKGVTPLNCRLSITKSRETSKRTYADKKIVFTLPDGVSSNAEVWRNAMRGQRPKISNIINGADILVILTGLGDEFNSAVTSSLAGIARSNNIMPVIIASVPFAFESEQRQIYLSSMQQLPHCNGAVFMINNECVLSKLDVQSRLSQALYTTDSQIAEAVAGIICAFSRTQSYSLDKRDVIRLFRNGGFSYFGYGNGSGDDKAKQALQAALNNSLSSGKVCNSRKVMYYIECGYDSTIDEISWIANNLVKEVAPNAELSMAVKFDGSFTGSIRLSVYCMDCRENDA